MASRLKRKMRQPDHSSLLVPQLPTIDPSDRLAHLIKDTSKAMARSLQTRLAQQSVAYGHWTFLRLLWVQNGISQTRLSELAGVMTPSTYGAIRAMTKLGYVTRRQKKGNRKTVYIYLTPYGWSLKDLLVPLAVEVNHVAMKGVTKSEAAQFRKVLLTILTNLGRKRTSTGPAQVEKMSPARKDISRVAASPR
jgi:MarR family transcriptional regulator, organic hydroperoxide resistance regulator